MKSLRLVSDGPMGHQTRVLYQPAVDPDDWFTPVDPIDLSHVFSDVEVSLSVGDVNRAHLTALAVHSDLEISPRRMTVRTYKPRPRWLRWLGYS